VVLLLLCAAAAENTSKRCGTAGASPSERTRSVKEHLNLKCFNEGTDPEIRLARTSQFREASRGHGVQERSCASYTRYQG
jgi:hypothetical protein